MYLIICGEKCLIFRDYDEFLSFVKQQEDNEMIKEN